MSLLIILVLYVPLFVIVLGTVMSFFGETFYIFDLASHLRYLLALAAGILAIALVSVRRRVGLALAVLTFGINAGAVAYWHMPARGLDEQPFPALDREPVGVRMLVANLGAHNTEYAPFDTLLSELEPQIAVLIEPPRGWLEALRERPGYPYKHVATHEGAGVMVISQLPTDSQTVFIEGRPAIQSTLFYAGRRVRVLSIHPPPPVSAEQASDHADTLRAAASLLDPSIGMQRWLVGDLNTTMFSARYLGLERATGLRNVRKGRGIMPTWPAWLPWLGLPLDHVLVGPQTRVSTVRVTRAFGSDHRGLLVELVI